MKNPFARKTDRPTESDDTGESGHEEQEPGQGRTLMFGVAGLVAIAALGVGAFFLLSTDGGSPPTGSPATKTITLAIPQPGQIVSSGEGDDSGGMPPTGGGMAPSAPAAAPANPPALATTGEPATVPGVPATPKTMAVQPGAFEAIPTPPPSQPLDTTPQPDLMDPSTDGPLPKIAADGRQPWKIYARPFDQRDDRPRISVLVTGLGLSGAATQAAITKLPAAVSLAFDPYGRDIDGWVPKARAAGHEVFLGLPMEPFDYPRSDPGPLGLLKSLRAEENIGRLYKVMGKAAGYVGLVTTMGSEFANSDANVRPVVEVLLRRGVMVVDGRSTPETRIAPTAATIGAPHASVDLKVDRIPSRRAIDGKLKEVEAEARRRSVVLVTASPLPVTIERLAAWSETLEAKSLVLAPVSAVANKQMSP